MNIFIENETKTKFDFDYEKVISRVINASADYIGCPYEYEVNVILIEDEEMKKINFEQRGINNTTDVLSFPFVEYEMPGEFEFLENDFSAFNPETGELILGDILISTEKLLSQAKEYNHSQLRELAFLITHSMLHLFGYDHIDDNDRIIMEEKQKEILAQLNINR